MILLYWWVSFLVEPGIPKGVKKLSAGEAESNLPLLAFEVVLSAEDIV